MKLKLILVIVVSVLQYISWYEELYRDKKIKLMNSINMFITPWIPIENFTGTFDGNNYGVRRHTLVQLSGRIAHYHSLLIRESLDWNLYYAKP